MLESSSPEPIRLRRRLLASGTAVGSLVMTVWALGAMIGNAQTLPHSQHASGQGAAASPTQSAAAGSTGSSDPSAPAARPLAAAGGTDSSAPAPPSSLSRGKPMAACTPGALAVDTAPHQGDYRAGDVPHFQLSVTNTGDAECYADFSAGRRTLRLLGTGGRTVWTSGPIGAPMEVRRLSPGQTIPVDVAGPSVAPGRYAVTGAFGALDTAPHRFDVR